MPAGPKKPMSARLAEVSQNKSTKTNLRKIVLEHGIRSADPSFTLSQTDKAVRSRLLIFSINKELQAKKYSSSEQVTNVYNLIDKVHKIIKSEKAIEYKKFKPNAFKHFLTLEKKYAGELGQILRSKQAHHPTNMDIMSVSNIYLKAITEELAKFNAKGLK